MATKLSAEQAKRAKALSIKASNEEDLREKLLEILEENDLPGMEEEDTDMLLDLAESLSDSNVDDNEEVEEKPAKKATKKVVEEDDDEEDDEPKKPAKKAVKEEAKPAKKVAKEEKPAKKAVSKRGTKLNPKVNEEDRDAILEIVGEMFPEKNYIYAWVSTAGVTIKYKGKNSNRAIILIENATRHEDGKITFNLFFLTFGKKKELLDEAGVEYSNSWNNVPFVKSIDSEEAMELLEQFESELKDSVKTIDKKMGDNRAKMEEKLKSEKSTKKPAKVEEEDDEEDEKPAKKTSKKAVVEDDDDEEDEPKKPAKKSKK